MYNTRMIFVYIVQHNRWFFKKRDELFRTLNRHRFTADEGVAEEDVVVSDMIEGSSSLICNCAVVNNMVGALTGVLIDDDLLWLLKHDLRVVDDVVATAAAMETDDDFLAIEVCSIGNSGFDFIKDVVTTVSEPFKAGKDDDWEAENMAYTLSDSSDQWAEHSRYFKGTHTSLRSIQRPLVTNDPKYGPWQWLQKLKADR